MTHTSFPKVTKLSSPSSQSKTPNLESSSVLVGSDTDVLLESEQVDAYEDSVFQDEKSLTELQDQERAERRRRRRVRLFCFSCNRYEGHAVAARRRLFYSFVLGFTFGLYRYLGLYACNCCGSVRLGRYDWLNLRFWYRTIWVGGSARAKKNQTRRRG